MNNKLLELKEKVKNGDFDDNELIDLILHLERENQLLLEEIKKYKEVIDKAIENEEEIMYLANKVAITTQNVEIKAVRDRLEEIFKILKGDSNE